MTYILPIGIIVALSALWIAIWYVVVKYVTGIIGQLTAVKWVTNKRFVFVTSIITGVAVAFLIHFLWVITNPAKNDKTAYIEAQGSGYKITVTGKKLLMVHDPGSWIFRDTYDVSASFLVPRKNGIITNSEIQLVGDNHKPGGTIVIDQQKMTIQLFYRGDQKSPVSWNGTYILKAR